MSNQRLSFISDKIRESDASLSLVHRFCVVAAELLRAQSASIALVIDQAYSAIAASSPLGTLLEEQQFAFGDGPTYDSRESPIPIIVEDMTDRHSAKEWPAFAPVASKHDIRAVYAFPLRVGSAYLGVLTVYRVEHGEPTAQEYADGLILAALATNELVRQQAGIAAGDVLSSSEPGLSDQSTVQIAAGMVAEALNCSIVSALVRIRARAFADDKPVNDIARAIVARELILTN